MIKKRIVRKSTPQPTPEPKRRGGKAGQKKLIKETMERNLDMMLKMPDEMCMLHGWTPEQLEQEIIGIETLLGRSKRGTMARRKGGTYERTIARKFMEAWGIKLTRTPMSGGFQKSQENESMRGDLSCLDESIYFRLGPECKNQATWNLNSWYKQAEEDTPEGKIPIVIFHRPQKIQKGKREQTAEDFVMIKLSDFFNIVDVDSVIMKK